MVLRHKWAENGFIIGSRRYLSRTSYARLLFIALAVGGAR